MTWTQVAARMSSGSGGQGSLASLHCAAHVGEVEAGDSDAALGD